MSTGNIKTKLKQRGKTHGGYKENFRVIQNLKAMMKDSPNWDKLPPEMKESLEMIAVKVGRVLVGDPATQDTWEDIEGYAHLISQDLPKPVV